MVKRIGVPGYPPIPPLPKPPTAPPLDARVVREREDELHVLDAIARRLCYACGWRLAATADDGCVPFNCSYRPGESHEDHAKWLSRAKIMEAVRQRAAAERARALALAAPKESRNG